MAPLDDKRVRQALNLAVDREAFVGTLLPEGVELATAIVPPSTLGWNEELEPKAYDPERARELLAAAEADGVPVDRELSLIGRTGNYPNVTEVMEALRSMFSEVGFNVDLQMYEVAEFENLYSKPYPEDRKPSLVTALHDNARGDPVFSMYWKYHSEGRQSGIDDPHVDELITQATAATGAEREQLWSDLFGYLHNDIVADMLLFHMVGFARVNPRLEYEPTIATNSQLRLSEIGFN